MTFDHAVIYDGVFYKAGENVPVEQKAEPKKGRSSKK